VRHVEMKPEAGNDLPCVTQILRPGQSDWTTVQRVSREYSLMPHRVLVEHLDMSVTRGFGAGGSIDVSFCGDVPSTRFHAPSVEKQAAMLAIVEHPEFPVVNLGKTVHGEDDLVRFRLVAWNSYDKSRALKVALGAIRFVCSNGMYFPAYLFAELKFVHYKQQDWGNLHSLLKGMLESSAPKCKELWLAMKERVVTDADREEFREAFCDEELIPLNESVDTLFDGRDNATFWDLYNACTHYATHRPQHPETRRLINERIAKYFYPQEECEEKQDATFVPGAAEEEDDDEDEEADDDEDASDDDDSDDGDADDGSDGDSENASEEDEDGEGVSEDDDEEDEQEDDE